MSGLGWPTVVDEAAHREVAAAGLGWPGQGLPGDGQQPQAPVAEQPAEAEPRPDAEQQPEQLAPPVEAEPERQPVQPVEPEAEPEEQQPQQPVEPPEAQVEGTAEPAEPVEPAEPAAPGPTEDAAAAEPPPAAAPEAPATGPALASRLQERLAADPPPAGADLPIAEAAAAATRIRSGVGLVPFPKPARRRVLSVANQKGGVGKTTTTVNLAVAMALHGLDVLVVDLDPQGNASTGLGVEHHAGVPGVYDVLIEGAPLAEVAVPAPGLDRLHCVPATIDLAGAEIELVSVVARESRLDRAVRAYDRPCDVVLIDCPPSLGLLTVNALVAAEELLIPIQCEYYALEGLGQLLKNVDLVRAHLNARLHVGAILLTMYDARTRLADQVAQEVRDHFGDVVLDAVIPRSVRVSEAPGYGQSVVTYDPASRGARTYVDAARELVTRGARDGAGA